MDSNDLMIGVAGEHIVCFDLIRKGFTAFMSDQGLPYDVIVDVGGVLKRIQVKTTRTHTETPQRKKRYPSYMFHVRRCGKGGRRKYELSDVDVFALVCIETKQVGYIKHEEMPMSLSVRVDAFKGKYLNEVQDYRRKLVFELKDDGLTNAQIAEEIGMDRSVVSKVLKGDFKKKDDGVYFSDLTFEKAMGITQ